jgi:hypothetical protein
MRLANNPNSLTSLRKNSRYILEKFRDLYRPRKFQKIISRNEIASSTGKIADIQVTIDYILKSYECHLAIQQNVNGFPNRKKAILYNNLKTLSEKIKESCSTNCPVSKKYVSNVLKAQTVFFNALNSKKINKGCKDPYDKLILSAISVWNNDWARI